MFTKQHYKAIAGIICRNYEVTNEPVKFVLNDIVDELSQYFERDNERFDRQKFVEACGIS